MSETIAILSMLHEPATPNSATRLFLDRPVLAGTFRNLSRASGIGSAHVVCWEDQSEAVAEIIRGGVKTGAGAKASAAQGPPLNGDVGSNSQIVTSVVCKGRRQPVAALDALSAAGRWLDGWRGGLLQSCDFDLGFHGKWIAEIAGKNDVLLIDPAAALVQPDLLSRVFKQAAEHPDLDMVFTQAAPGLAGVLVKNSLLVQLAEANHHPGKLLHYLPERPSRDPIAGEACAEIPVSLARTTRNFKLNSRRQIDWLESAFREKHDIDFRGSHEGYLAAIVSLCDPAKAGKDWSRKESPREITLEITTRRSTFPAFGPSQHFPFHRPDLALDDARKLFDDLSQIDDLRLTFGGVGDPLCHPGFFEIVEAARAAGVTAMHVETDLYELDTAQVAGLVETPIDVVSVNLPAATAATYQKLMGINGYETVLHNIKQLVLRRQGLGRGTPIIVPTFTKCRSNFAEMEIFYDQWLRALGVAVITSSGNMPSELALTDVAPPQRRPCNHLQKSLTILCDGQVVTCQHDIAGRQSLGQIGRQKIADIWNGKGVALRTDHENRNWQKHPVCASCKEWHRS